MATDIQLKRSYTAGSVPGAANVLVGEPVVNLADKIIFSKDGDGNVVVIGAGTTSNVVEGSNLYFTNTRARAAFTAGTNITIADGVISSSGSSNFNNFEFDYGYIYDATISTAISPIDYGSI
jgi:hypothetical protein